MLQQQLQAHTKRLKMMGWTFIGLASFFSGCAYSLPNSLMKTWIPSYSQEGVFAISALLAFLGLYCLGAIWRKRYFIS